MNEAKARNFFSLFFPSLFFFKMQLEAQKIKQEELIMICERHIYSRVCSRDVDTKIKGNGIKRNREEAFSRRGEAHAPFVPP